MPEGLAFFKALTDSCRIDVVSEEPPSEAEAGDDALIWDLGFMYPNPQIL